MASRLPVIEPTSAPAPAAVATGSSARARGGGDGTLPLPASPSGGRAIDATLPSVRPTDLEGLRRISDTLYDFGVQQRKVQDTIALGQAHAQATRDLDAARVELDKDGDYATKADRFAKKAQEIGARIGQQFDGDTAAQFQSRFLETAATMETSVRHAARQDEVQQGRVTLASSNDDLVLKASTARSTGERDAILKQVDDNLTNAVNSGIITAAQHKVERSRSLGKYDEAVAMSMMRSNPGGLIAAVKDPEQFKYLDPVKRQVLANQAQARLETLGATARMEARADAADVIDSLRQGVLPADLDQRRTAIGRVDAKLAARIDGEVNTYKSVQTFRTQPLPDQATTLQGFVDKEKTGGGLTAEERHAYLRMSQVHQQEIQKWVQDPFTTALNTSPTVKELFDRQANSVEDPNVGRAALDASIDWQTRNGVPASHLAVIGRPQAKALSEELAGLDGAALNQRLAQLKQQYGPHFDKLTRQLSAEQHGLGKIPSLQTALELPDTPEGQAARANLIDAGKVAQGDLKKLFPTDADLTKTQQSVEDELTPLRSSLRNAQGGMATLARYRDDAVRMAAQFQMQGMSPADASKRAVEQLVGSHYAFINDNGGTLRVPKSVDNQAVSVDVVRHNLDAARAGLDPKDLQAPPDLTPGANADRGAESFARRVQQYGRWQTLQGGRGAVLTYEANGRMQPVLRKDGKPVVVDFTAPATVAPVRETPAGVVTP